MNHQLLFRSKRRSFSPFLENEFFKPVSWPMPVGHRRGSSSLQSEGTKLALLNSLYFTKLYKKIKIWTSIIKIKTTNDSPEITNEYGFLISISIVYLCILIHHEPPAITFLNFPLPLQFIDGFGCSCCDCRIAIFGQPLQVCNARKALYFKGRMVSREWLRTTCRAPMLAFPRVHIDGPVDNAFARALLLIEDAQNWKRRNSEIMHQCTCVEVTGKTDSRRVHNINV